MAYSSESWNELKAEVLAKACAGAVATKFRWHRGQLSDSMATVVEFDGTKEALLCILMTEDMGWWPALAPDMVEVKHYFLDARIGLDTYIVTVNGDACGFTDGPLASPGR